MKKNNDFFLYPEKEKGLWFPKAFIPAVYKDDAGSHLIMIEV
jgi:hypothetical protein